MAPLMKLDITAMPIPLPETMNISTNSRFRLKYCATISVEQSLVMPTPIPEMKRTNRYKHYFFMTMWWIIVVTLVLSKPDVKVQYGYNNIRNTNIVLFATLFKIKHYYLYV